MADVEVRGVSKRFDDLWAVKQVSFTAPAGSFVSLLGPSGCGKTTTLRLIAGFQTPDEGEVLIGGGAVNALPPWQRNLGVVFQNYALFPFMTVFDNVAFGLRRRNVGRNETNQRVAEALDLVGLPGLERRYPRQLSGGQQQRVALARALVIRPEVLLLDEPLSNLDAKLRGDMRFELKRIQRETGVTSIFVTHDQEEALTLSDQIVVMNLGEVRGGGAPKQVWENPGSAFVADFLGVENLFPGTVARTAANGQIDVVLAGGGAELSAAPKGHSINGGDVVLGIRSSDVALSAQRESGAVNIVEGVVREFTYLGSFIAYQIETKQYDRPVIATSKLEFSVADPVWLHFDPAKLMVLEGDGA